MKQEVSKLKEENELLTAKNNFMREKIEYLDRPACWDAAKVNEIYHKTKEENAKLKERIGKLRSSLSCYVIGGLDGNGFLDDAGEHGREVLAADDKMEAGE